MTSVSPSSQQRARQRARRGPPGRQRSARRPVMRPSRIAGGVPAALLDDPVPICPVSAERAERLAVDGHVGGTGVAGADDHGPLGQEELVAHLAGRCARSPSAHRPPRPGSRPMPPAGLPRPRQAGVADTRRCASRGVARPASRRHRGQRDRSSDRGRASAIPRRLPSRTAQVSDGRLRAAAAGRRRRARPRPPSTRDRRRIRRAADTVTRRPMDRAPSAGLPDRQLRRRRRAHRVAAGRLARRRRGARRQRRRSRVGAGVAAGAVVGGGRRSGRAPCTLMIADGRASRLPVSGIAGDEREVVARPCVTASSTAQRRSSGGDGVVPSLPARVGDVDGRARARRCRGG